MDSTKNHFSTNKVRGLKIRQIMKPMESDQKPVDVPVEAPSLFLALFSSFFSIT